MYPAKRIKRASVQDIYRSCVQGGDCPEDVKNKVEGTTWADTLLKIFSSVIYLGNLGIGTGRGGGGSMGYRPLGAQTPNTGTGVPAPPRPSIPTVDVIGPQEVLPITPDAPIIVPLEEGIPDVGLIDTPGGGPGLGAETIDITTSVDPLSEVTGVGEHPNILGASEDAAQIDVPIDIQLSPPPPKKIALDPMVTDNISVIEIKASHVDPDINVFVDAQFDGINIGHPEEIELQEINLREEFDIDEGPLRSTPLSNRAISRARDLYHRFVQQVPTRSADLFSWSSRPNTFEFENPAFDDVVTEEFRRDLASVSNEAEALPTQFIGSPRLSELPDQTVRISRLGKQPGITTRSGLQIGQKIHYYHDFSPIHEIIELQPVGEYSHEATIVDQLATSSFINPFENAINGFSDDQLLDTFEEDFSQTHLVVIGGFRDDVEMPSIATTFTINTFVNIPDTSIVINNTGLPLSPINIPSEKNVPVVPGFDINVEASDFNIHPSVLRRKRKRSMF
ncbi:L2 [Human papillomavirus 154]|uniref:Minor capsid protein L2 n=1 Tax=Human papillomavirus 154 TaxID=1195796 RepID=R9QCJ0_9PAPI|nr:L2 [Human papillomavirus 154]AFL02851.1 L2 [Human papillomavirus 154]